MSWFAKLLGIVPKKEREGISLGNSPSWMISTPSDISEFFRALSELVPPGSNLYLEDSYDKAVEDYLSERPAKNVCKVAVGTIWPRPKMFHIPITRDNLGGLAKLAERYSICVHIHAYNNGKVIVEWYDAFGKDPLYVSKEIPEEKVKEFCNQLRTTYREGHCV